MVEHPILFSAPMVRAILAGDKTQTRRPAPIERIDFIHGGALTWAVHFTKPTKGALATFSGGLELTEEQARHIIASQYCPYGAPGDRLWVRETHYRFGTWAWDDGRTKTGMQKWKFVPDNRDVLFERPDELCTKKIEHGWFRRVSLFLPRWAARTLLEIVSVRVEHVQEISEADAVAEGIERAPDFFGCPVWKGYGNDSDLGYPDDPVGSYQSLWDSLNSRRGLCWDENPWVWVIEFKRVEVPA